MRMKWCDCRPKDYDRLPRSWWKYLLPRRRLVQCRQCGRKMLVAL